MLQINTQKKGREDMKKKIWKFAGCLAVAGIVLVAVPVTEVFAAKRTDSGNTAASAADLSNAEQIACETENLRYLGGKIYALDLYRSEQNTVTGAGINENGLLAAVSYDFDGDGQNEIFSVSYKESAQAENGKAVTFSLLKEIGNSWNVVSGQEILHLGYQGEYRDMTEMSGGIAFSETSVFLRKMGEQYQFFCESYGEGQIATGQFWSMDGFYLENDELKPIEVTRNIFYEGSPIEELWNPEIVGEEYYEEGDIIFQAYTSLFIDKPRIEFGHMTVDQNPGMYEILRMKKSSLCSDEERNQWMSVFQNGQDPGKLKFCSYQITDESSEMPDIIQGYRTDVILEEDETEGAEGMAEESDYIIPESDSRYLSREELSGLSLQQLNYAKNEIYARRGRLFNSAELQNYFNSKSWYCGSIAPADFDSVVTLNEYEIANASLLSEIEFSTNPNGYPLDQS